MPRAKVKPQDRQRVVKACARCKASKIRCDAAIPCSNCLKRRRASACVYPDTDHEKQGSARRNSQGSNASTSRTEAHSRVGEEKNGRATHTNTRIPVSSTSRDSVSPRDDETQPQARSLLSSKQQRVYVGETANLSYLQFLRRILKRSVGPCAFTENPCRDYMLEDEIQGENGISLDYFSTDSRRSLVQSYLNASSGIIHPYTQAEVLASVDNVFAPDNPIGAAAAHLVLAIGAQAQGPGVSEPDYAPSIFSKARVLAFEGMLIDPSLDMVRHFTLMAFYMLGACHRNAAFMYLGVASKAASALGLHRAEPYQGLSDLEWGQRMRAWKSLRSLDMIVNTLLGRAGGLSSLPKNDPGTQVLALSREILHCPGEVALYATFNICPLMDELTRAGSNQDISFASDFLKSLQEWSKALPDELRQRADAQTAPTTSYDRTVFIGGTHVACVYYFAVILTTRRFLTQFLLPQVGDSEAIAERPTATQVSSEVKSMALVCLDAALHLAKVGYSAMVAGQLMANMCIMKAWMFAAGLVLGFAMFARGTGTDREADSAFHQARAVLERLGIQSRQARHYYEILTSFSEAIDLSQQKRSESMRQITSRYMDQIFTSNVGEQATDDTRLGTSVESNGGISLSPSRNMSLAAGSDLNSILIDGTDISAYDLPDMQGFGDALSSDDWQPFAPFFADLI